MTLALLGLLLGLVWAVRRGWPYLVPGGGPATARVRPSPEDRLRTAWRALALLGALLLLYAWGSGLVIEEARTYAQLQGLPPNDGEPQRTYQRVVLVCAAVVLLAAALLRSSVRARRS